MFNGMRTYLESSHYYNEICSGIAFLIRLQRRVLNLVCD